MESVPLTGSDHVIRVSHFLRADRPEAEVVYYASSGKERRTLVLKGTLGRNQRGLETASRTFLLRQVMLKFAIRVFDRLRTLLVWPKFIYLLALAICGRGYDPHLNRYPLREFMDCFGRRRKA
jgi:hypothetical protein